VGAAVVAIILALYDPREENSISMKESFKRLVDISNLNTKIWAQRGLIFFALIICAIAIYKGYDDNNQKELVKSSVTETLNPTPTIINQIYDDVKKMKNKDGYHVDYSNNADGMVIYIKIRNKENQTLQPFENIILSNSDLAKIYANIILK